MAFWGPVLVEQGRCKDLQKIFHIRAGQQPVQAAEKDVEANDCQVCHDKPVRLQFLALEM